MTVETRLSAVLTDVLATAIAAYDGFDLDVPSRRFIAHGVPALDCDTLVVHTTAAPAILAAPCAVVLTYSIAVTIADCYPTIADGELTPDTTAETNAALDLARHLDVLFTGLANAAKSATLVPTLALACDDVTFTGVRAIGPAGGIAGWEIGMNVDATATPA